MLELGFRVSAPSPAYPLPSPPRVALPPPALLRAMRPGAVQGHAAAWLCDGESSAELRGRKSKRRARLSSRCRIPSIWVSTRFGKEPPVAGHSTACPVAAAAIMMALSVRLSRLAESCAGGNRAREEEGRVLLSGRAHSGCCRDSQLPLSTVARPALSACREAACHCSATGE